LDIALDDIRVETNNNLIGTLLVSQTFVRPMRDRGAGCVINIASAAAHLHAQGLMHGDLYAHNILHDGAGGALLGDFGAASFHPAAQADALERIEVRAFGCLMEELMQRSDSVSPALQALQARCVQPTAASRPGFAEISAQLDALR
jgi:tRNA A-37 threonylcarbamoyl transferase component Bud32